MGLLQKSQLVELFGFLAPGIIIIFFLRLVKAGPRTEYKFLLLHYVIASSFFYIIVKPWFYYTDGVAIPIWLHAMLFFVCVPIIIGIALARIGQTEWIYKFLDKIGIRARPLIEDAWDYTFSKTMGSGKYVIITLTNGTQIYGLIGRASFISSGSARDILVEDVYELDDTGQWKLAIPAKSVYIKGAQIALIELLRAEHD